MRAKIQAYLGFLVAVVGCHRSTSKSRDATTDPAILRGALSDWQEGPTDGRVCLDPRVLPADSTSQPSRRWADTVLAALLSDTLVAVDSTIASPSNVQTRLCAPTGEHARISLGFPLTRGDSIDIVTQASLPTTVTGSARDLRIGSVLTRVGTRWVIARRRGQQFQSLPLNSRGDR